jgi:hypothetical protein
LSAETKGGRWRKAVLSKAGAGNDVLGVILGASLKDFTEQVIDSL